MTRPTMVSKATPQNREQAAALRFAADMSLLGLDLAKRIKAGDHVPEEDLRKAMGGVAHAFGLALAAYPVGRFNRLLIRLFQRVLATIGALLTLAGTAFGAAATIAFLVWGIDGRLERAGGAALAGVAMFAAHCWIMHNWPRIREDPGEQTELLQLAAWRLGLNCRTCGHPGHIPGECQHADPDQEWVMGEHCARPAGTEPGARASGCPCTIDREAGE